MMDATSASRLSTEDCHATSDSVCQNSPQLAASCFAAKPTTSRIATQRTTSRILALVDFAGFGFEAGTSSSDVRTVVTDHSPHDNRWSGLHRDQSAELGQQIVTVPD